MKKIISTSAIVASALLLCSLVGCGGTNSTPQGESETLKILKAIQAQQAADAATIKAQQDKLDAQAKLLAELDGKTKPTVAQANLQTQTVSNGVATFHIPIDQPVVKKQHESESSDLLVVKGKTSIANVTRAREVKAELCIVPPTFIGQPAPVFQMPAQPMIMEQPMQQQAPLHVAPVPPVAPMPQQPPMQAPQQAPMPMGPAPQVAPAAQQVWLPAQARPCH